MYTEDVDPITFLTWNMAMLRRSDSAPVRWHQEDTEAAFRTVMLELDPDIILLQELPGLVPFVETHGMVRANPRSHSGNLATLVRHELLATEPITTVVPGCAILTTFHQSLTIANVHLAPGSGGASDRLEQLATIVEASPTACLLIAGDTNTRVDELVSLADAGLIGLPPPRPTWDSKKNRFNRDGPRFTAYFTRWFASPGVEVADVRVLDSPLTVDGHRFHLSDHYPLMGGVQTV